MSRPTRQGTSDQSNKRVNDLSRTRVWLRYPWGTCSSSPVRILSGLTTLPPRFNRDELIRCKHRAITMPFNIHASRPVSLAGILLAKSTSRKVIPARLLPDRVPNNPSSRRYLSVPWNSFVIKIIADLGFIKFGASRDTKGNVSKRSEEERGGARR